MSRTSTGKPVYRLAFGYPNIVVGRPDGQDVEVPLDSGDCEDRLRRLADEIGTVGGQLVALLPEAEVWRGPGVAPSAVRRKAADALGSRPEDLAVARYPAWPASPQSFAAVRRKTLVEARAFLDRCGLKPAAITAAGPFPGFGAPPSFGRLAAVGPDQRRAAVSGVAAALALLVWLAPWRAEPPAAVAEAVAPVVQSGVSGPETLAPPAASAPARAIRIAAARPAPRPADFVPVRRAETRVTVPPRQPAPRMVLAARNLPADLEARSPGRAAAVPTAPTAAVAPPARRPLAPDSTAAPVARSERGPDGAERPLARPGAASATRTSASAGPRGDGPYPRPLAVTRADADANLVASLGAAISASDVPRQTRRPSFATGPLPRPATLLGASPIAPTAAAPALLASLGPAAAFAAVAPPEPRRIAQPVRPAAAKPAPAAAAPARVQPQRAVVAKAQPVTVRRMQQPVAVVRAQPAPLQARLQTARVRPQAAPARQAAVVRLQPAKPARVQQAPVRASAARPQPTRQAATTRQAGSARGVALVGIFGTAEGRHALVQLSNGKTQRVRAGDDVQGVQVTAIASDAVHLRARGRDSVLTLPD